MQGITTKRALSIILSVCMVLVSMFTGLTVVAEDTATYEATRITIHPGIDETRLNFSWHSDEQASPATVRIKAHGAEEWIEFTGESNAVKTSDSGHQDGYHDTFVKNCGHTCSDVCGHPACSSTECYHGIYASAYYNRVTVSGLEFNTTYTYQLGDGTNWSIEYTTKTADSDPSEDGFQYLVFGDSQTADQYYGDYMKKALELAIAEFPDTDFMMNLGDNIHENNDRNYNAYFTSQDILASIPIAVVMGNHELNIGALENHPALTFTNPPAADGRQDYWFRYGDALFITFNSGPQETAMMEDLDKLIANAIEAHPDARWKILQTHQGFYANNNGGKVWRKDFTTVLQKYDIDLVFNGHHHLYTRTESLVYDATLTCSHDKASPVFDCAVCSGSVESADTITGTVDETYVASDGVTKTEYTKTTERTDPEGITYIHLDSLTAEGHDQYVTSAGEYLAPTSAFSINTVEGQGAITRVSVTQDTLKVETFWINNNGTPRIRNSADISLLDDDFIEDTPYDSYTIHKTTDVKDFEVTFDGGSDRGIFTRRINSGETVAEPENPILSGKSFKYWSLDGETEFNFNTVLNESVTITAVYEDIPPTTTADLFIEAVKRGDSEIILESDITITDKDIITISSGTVIKSAEGQQYTITLDGSTRLATASGSTVTFQGINITLASTINTMSSGYNSGGYIKVGSSSAKLYIYDCNIYCEATSLGTSNAAIIRPVQNTVCRVYIENSKITANLANEKGALIGGFGATYHVKDSTLKAKSGSWLSCDTPTIVLLGESTYTGWSSGSTKIYNFTNTTVKAVRNSQNLIELSKIGSGIAATNDSYKIYYSLNKNAFSNDTAIEYTEPIADVDYETPIYVAIRYTNTSYYGEVATKYCGEYIEGVAVATEEALVNALSNGDSVITITSNIDVTDKIITIAADTVIQSKLNEQYVITLKGTSRIDISGEKQLTLDSLQIIVDENAATIDDGYWYGYITVRNGAKLYVYDCHIEGKAQNYGSSTSSLVRVTHSDSNPGNVYIEGSTIVSTSTSNGGGALNGTVIGGVGPTFRIVDTSITGDWIFYEGYVILEGATTLNGNAYKHNAVILDFRNAKVRAVRNESGDIELNKIGTGASVTNANYKIFYSLDENAFENGTPVEYTAPIADIGIETPVYVAIGYTGTYYSTDMTFYSTSVEKYCGEYGEGIKVSTADELIEALGYGEPIITLTADIDIEDYVLNINSETLIKSSADEKYTITLKGSSRIEVLANKQLTLNSVQVIVDENADTIDASTAYSNYGYITVRKGAKLYIYSSKIVGEPTDYGSVDTQLIKIARVASNAGYVYIENSTVDASAAAQNKGVALGGGKYESGKPLFRLVNTTVKGYWSLDDAYFILEGTTTYNWASNPSTLYDFRKASVLVTRNAENNIELGKSGTGSAVTNDNYKIYYSLDEADFTNGTATEYTGAITDIGGTTPIYVALGYNGTTYYSTPVKMTVLYLGDIDNDGIVNAEDLTSFVKYFLNIDSCDASVADVNGDGTVDIRDLVCLKNKIASIT